MTTIATVSAILHPALERRIHTIRDHNVMPDADVAALYEVETSNLNKAVKRNLSRFPQDFMFQLTKEEWSSLIFQLGRSNTAQGGRRQPQIKLARSAPMGPCLLYRQITVLVIGSSLRNSSNSFRTPSEKPARSNPSSKTTKGTPPEWAYSKTERCPSSNTATNNGRPACPPYIRAAVPCWWRVAEPPRPKSSRRSPSFRSLEKPHRHP